MKNKLLALLALPAFCLAACGASFKISNKTFVYKDASSSMDVAYNSNYSKTTTREYITKYFDKIDFTRCTPTISDTSSADAVINEMETKAPEALATTYKDVSIATNKDENTKTATVTMDGVTTEYTYEFENDYDLKLKDSEGEVRFEVLLYSKVNNTIPKAVVTQMVDVLIGTMEVTWGTKYTLPLTESVTIEDGVHVLSEITVNYTAVFKA